MPRHKEDDQELKKLQQKAQELKERSEELNREARRLFLI